MRNILKGYHERTAIGVTLSAGTGGTASFVPTTGTSYRLSSLPRGTQVALTQIQGVDTYVFSHNGSEIGSLSITASSGYKLNSVAVNSTTVTSTPIKLNDGDTINVVFGVPNYLSFTANTAGSTVQLAKNNTPTEVTLETSADKINWTTYTIGDTITLTNVGDKVYWRNTSETNTIFSTNSYNYYKFVMTGSVNGSGDVTSLINKNGTTTLVGDYTFARLFYECSSLKTSPEFPATTLTRGCYETMFYMSGITAAPALPATTLAPMCYSSMFQMCQSLVTPPELPATTLAERCYQNMFNSTRITTRPALPATTLAPYCYYNMFAYTSGASVLPELPATTLASNCYREMFQGCRGGAKLSETQTGAYQTPYRIPSSGTGVDASNSMTNMFISTSGTFTGTPTINTTYYTSNTVVPAS